MLSIWAIYILLNGFIQQMPVSCRLLEYLGLIVFYIILRQIEPSKYGILLMAMLIGGITQAIYGNMQLWGYYPSHHSVFQITGSFFNPGPFAGYLASVYPAVLGICLFKIRPLPVTDKKFNNIINVIGRRVSGKYKPVHWLLSAWMAGISLMVILLILIPSQSRASWMAVGIASAMLLMNRYLLMNWIKKYSLLKRCSILLLMCFMIGASIFGLFLLKTDSANGRLLIWKVTGTMIAERPFTGTGFDRFKSFYMTGQAAYFEHTPNSPEAMVAGDVNYTFNEFLQHTAENGMVGLVLLLFILTIAFRVVTKPFNELAGIAKAGIIGIAVFACFSYPAQILPIKMSFTLYLACLSSLAAQKKWHIQAVKYIPVRCILVIFIAFGLMAGYQCLHVERAARKNWNTAYRFYTINNYTGCLPYYEMAWSVLNTDGDYLTNYGKALSMAGKHKQAILVLHKAILYYPNIVVFTALGDSYKALGKPFEAEQSYLSAWYMNPSRFFTKYLLAKLYDETDQAEKAVEIAYELLHKEVKVESTAIREIREEMDKILKKYRN